jgi:hypothetical protein
MCVKEQLSEPVDKSKQEYERFVLIDFGLAKEHDVLETEKMTT